MKEPRITINAQGKVLSDDLIHKVLTLLGAQDPAMYHLITSPEQDASWRRSGRTLTHDGHRYYPRISDGAGKGMTWVAVGGWRWDLAHICTLEDGELRTVCVIKHLGDYVPDVRPLPTAVNVARILRQVASQ